jgi:hypothetical protein
MSFIDKIKKKFANKIIENNNLSTNYLAEAKKLLNELNYILPQYIKPCSKKDVLKLEKKIGHEIPTSFKEFLFWGGRQMGKIEILYEPIVGNLSRWCCEEHGGDEFHNPLNLTQEAKKNSSNNVLPENILVFLYDLEGGYFEFIKCNDGENPPVYSSYGDGFEKIFDSFSSYMINKIKEEFKNSKLIIADNINALNNIPTPDKILEELWFYGRDYDDITPLNYVPEKIFNYKNLKVLKLFFNCEINIFINKLLELKQLESLTLVSNKLIEFPDILLSINNLKYLELGSSIKKIDKISEKYINKSNIEILRLNNNKFDDFPHELMKLPKLKRFSFEKNNIETTAFEKVKNHYKNIIF